MTPFLKPTGTHPAASPRFQTGLNPIPTSPVDRVINPIQATKTILESELITQVVSPLAPGGEDDAPTST
ncbi:hypothetical protein [Synechococcus sp. MIT S1220]|uniref:hypothetical protein n=1 Tax=Synechococcus sp. MIT S1220 TaxID=3082549 RepID=UPI0039B116BD